jgi:hypothetical protein
MQQVIPNSYLRGTAIICNIRGRKRSIVTNFIAATSPSDRRAVEKTVVHETIKQLAFVSTFHHVPALADLKMRGRHSRRPAT